MNKTLLGAIAVLSVYLAASPYRPDRVIYADVKNGLQGPEYAHTEEVLKVFDVHRGWQPDLYIFVTSGNLREEHWDGVAVMTPFNCEITISDEYVSTEHDTTDILHYKHVMFGLVLRHEIGHCFGLEHSDDPANIMYPSFDDRQLLLSAHYRYTLDLQRIRTTK